MTFKRRETPPSKRKRRNTSDVLSSRKLPWNARRTPILLVSAVTVTNLHKHAHYPIEPTLCLHAVMIILGQENSFPPLTPQSVCVCMCVSHSVVSDSLWPYGLLFASLLCPWGFSRQEYWSGLPFPPPGSSQPRDQTQVSCIAGRFFTIWATRGDIKISFFCCLFTELCVHHPK